MEFQQFQQITKDLLAKDELDDVIKQFETFFQEQGILSGELPNDLYN